MKQIITIKKMTGDVRTSLCIEDIHIEGWSLLQNIGVFNVKRDSLGEDYIDFTYPFRVPRLNIFYASKISSITDKRLPELIKRLLYLNPDPNEFGFKKLASFILATFVRTRKVDSRIKPGESSSIPVIGHQEMMLSIVTINTEMAAARGEGREYLPDSEQYVMFSRKSEIGKGERISIKAQSRARVISTHYKATIHNVAELLIESEEYFKVTPSRISEGTAVVSDKGALSIRTVRKHMEDRTRNMIDEANECRPFKSSATLEKYNAFKRLGYMPIGMAAKTLGVSKSTIVQFRSIEEKSLTK